MISLIVSFHSITKGTNLTPSTVPARLIVNQWISADYKLACLMYLLFAHIPHVCAWVPSCPQLRVWPAQCQHQNWLDHKLTTAKSGLFAKLLKYLKICSRSRKKDALGSIFDDIIFEISSLSWTCPARPILWQNLCTNFGSKVQPVSHLGKHNQLKKNTVFFSF